MEYIYHRKLNDVINILYMHFNLYGLHCLSYIQLSSTFNSILHWYLLKYMFLLNLFGVCFNFIKNFNLSNCYIHSTFILKSISDFQSMIIANWPFPVWKIDVLHVKPMTLQNINWNCYYLKKNRNKGFC